MQFLKHRHRWPRRDLLILGGVVVISLALLYLQALMHWSSSIHEASRRFRDHKDNFYRSFQQHMDQSRGDGASLTLALRPDGSVDSALLQRICGQLASGTWARAELVLTRGVHPGRLACGSDTLQALAPQDVLNTQQLAHTRQPLPGPGSTRQAKQGQDPILEWLYPLPHAAGTPLPGFVRLHYRLQSGIDAAVRSQPDHGEYALDVDNPLSPDDGDDAYPPAPLLQSAHWPPGRYSVDEQLDGLSLPPWITHWDNQDYTTSSGQPYRLTLFARSPMRGWLVIEPAAIIVIALSAALFIVVIGMTWVLLRTRQRLRRAADSRRRRLARRARELKQAQEEQQLLEAALLDTSEREKQRLGSELHDGAGQSLTAARLLADSLASTLQPLPPALGALQSCLQQAVNEVRLGARGLTPAPLLEDGLEPALQALASQHDGSGVSVALQVHDTPPRLDPEARLHVYRIAQEAINNAIRHGQASQVTLALGHAPLLTVQDNGCGFDSAAVSHGIGLRSQQLRAGLLGRSLQLQTAPGRGTTVCLA